MELNIKPVKLEKLIKNFVNLRNFIERNSLKDLSHF